MFEMKLRRNEEASPSYPCSSVCCTECRRQLSGDLPSPAKFSLDTDGCVDKSSSPRSATFPLVQQNNIMCAAIHCAIEGQCSTTGGTERLSESTQEYIGSLFSYTGIHFTICRCSRPSCLCCKRSHRLPLLLGLQNALHHLGCTGGVLIVVSVPRGDDVVTFIQGHEPCQEYFKAKGGKEAERMRPRWAQLSRAKEVKKPTVNTPMVERVYDKLDSDE